MGCLKFITLAVLVSLVSFSFVMAATLTSTGGNFNVTPDVLYINWSSSYNGSLDLNSISSMVFYIDNSTENNTVRANYSQKSTGWTEWTFDPSRCGISSGFYFFVDNGTERVENTTSTTSATVLLDSYMDAACPPGRYWGMINVTNGSSTNYVNVTVVMDLPISSSNSLNSSLGLGEFRGTIGTSDKTYHHYYFNTSEVQNATSILVNLTQDIDVFLNSPGGLMAKSIAGSADRILYQYLPQGEMWELRLFDNSSSHDYAGFLMFSTLNATNATNPSQQFTSIDFGSMNASEMETVQVRLRNEGELNMSSVAEGMELYHTSSQSDTSPRNFTFRVPDFTTEIRVGLNWTGNASYVVRLYTPDGNLVSTSDGKYFNANISEFIQEEYAEYSSAVGLSNDGLWKAEVANNTPSIRPYNLTIKRWLDPSGWIDTSYSSANFDSLGGYQDFEFNFTVGNRTLSGIHSGSLKYTAVSGAAIRIPLAVNVTSPELFVNGTFNSSTISMSQNTGCNNTAIFNVTVNNTGNSGMTLSSSNSTALYHTNASNYINFSYVAPSSIGAGGSDAISVSVVMDTTKTNNVQGTYSGWIFLSAPDAHPYSGFNLTLSVTLTPTLTLNINNISTSNGDAMISNVSAGENVTLKTQIYYSNGTQIQDDLAFSNFGLLYIKNKNYTGYTQTFSESSFANASGTLWQAGPGQHHINFTIPASSTRPGGYYDVYVRANKTSGGVTLSGTGYNGTLTINNSALYMTAEDSSFSFEEGDEGDEGDEEFNLTVINYGPLTATGRITLSGSDNDCDYVEINKESAKSGCVASSSDDYFVVAISEGEECWFTWSFDLDNVTEDVECDAEIVVEDGEIYRSFGDVSIDIENIGSSTTQTSNQAGAGTEERIVITKYPSSLNIEQGESEKFIINVENPGDTDEYNIELEITGIESTWYKINPSELNLESIDEGDFYVNISVPSGATVKEYNLTFDVGNGDVSDSKSSRLRVMPSEGEEERINSSYGECNLNYTALESRMRQMVLEGRNVTELNESLVQIRAKLDQYCSYLERSDFFNAAQLERDVLSMILSADALAGNATEAEAGSLGISEEVKNYVWLFVGVVVIVIAGFLIYMFMPAPKESHAVKKFKYVSPEEASTTLKKMKKKIVNVFSRLKPRRKKEKEVKAGYSWKKK